MKNFNGKILFLDRSDINTDEIIPAKYLTELTKAALKPYCLEDLSLAGFDPKKDIAGKSAVVTRANFGCGSSREHAPWVLECNGINIVIAENFARIFRQNMFNCGLMAISLDRAAIDEIFKTFAGTDAELTTDFIVGFPGETDADFAATLDFARRAEFLQMHVFSYSRRAGTSQKWA